MPTDQNVDAAENKNATRIAILRHTNQYADS